MDNNSLEILAKTSVEIAANAAAHYISMNNYHYNIDTLLTAIKSKVKLYLPDTLYEVKEAFDCNMELIGVTNFRATMAKAGIEAAQEACYR